MKRFFTTLALIVTTLTTLHAQETEESSIIFGQDKQNKITISEDNVYFKIAGKELHFSSESRDSRNEKRHGSSLQAIQAFELGINILANTDYSMYNTKEATMMQFGNRKSTYVALNVFSENIKLIRSGSLSVDMGVGIAWENYVFAGDYSMRYLDGIMRPIELSNSVTKSKLMARYLHMPMLLNWTYRNKFFIAAGVNLDVSIGTRLKQKNPKIVYKSENVTLNPIQLGYTLHIGTEKLYGFINYSPMQMFESGTGPGGNRTSAGIGFSF